jgi:hypothetical protein
MTALPSVAIRRGELCNTVKISCDERIVATLHALELIFSGVVFSAVRLVYEAGVNEQRVWADPLSVR